VSRVGIVRDRVAAALAGAKKKRKSLTASQRFDTKLVADAIEAMKYALTLLVIEQHRRACVERRRGRAGQISGGPKT
jgi:hypothetical protein